MRAHANTLSHGPSGALDPARLITWMFLASVAMLFGAFASAYLIRRASSDWFVIELPRLMWLNTAILVLSSAVLEVGRQRGRVAGAWIAGAGLLGLLFLVGQGLVWADLARQGVFVPTSPHSSFFYILTGLHGLHLSGGLALLAVVWRRGRRRPARPIALSMLETTPEGLSSAATYWHFMGGLWIFLFLLLRFG